VNGDWVIVGRQKVHGAEVPRVPFRVLAFFIAVVLLFGVSRFVLAETVVISESDAELLILAAAGEIPPLDLPLEPTPPMPNPPKPCLDCATPRILPVPTPSPAPSAPPIPIPGNPNPMR
jgi:hypothetical protein